MNINYAYYFNLVAHKDSEVKYSLLNALRTVQILILSLINDNVLTASGEQVYRGTYSLHKTSSVELTAIFTLWLHRQGVPW